MEIISSGSSVSTAIHILIKCTIFSPIFWFLYRVNQGESEPQELGEAGQCQITQHLAGGVKNLTLYSGCPEGF